MPRGDGNPGQQPTAWERWFGRCCLLIPFVVLFSMVIIASVVELCSSSKVLEKESTFLRITEDDDDIHTTTVVALCGSVALLTAVGFSVCLMIVICAQCGEGERCSECRGVLLGILLLLMCICLLAGMGFSFSTSGYEFLHFEDKADFEAKFRRGALQSLRNYNSTHKHWDTFQEKRKCCGVNGWKDYKKVFLADTVPASCCNLKIINETFCGEIRKNVNTTDVYNHYIYSQGCSTVVYNEMGELFLQLYWSSISAGIAAGTCLLLLCVVLIVICTRSKLKDNNGCQQWLPNYEQIQ